jgi:DNA-binding transcriptional LysR family regulator
LVSAASCSPVAAALGQGNLERVLEDWCAPLPGYYLYYPNRRHPMTAFTAFVEALTARRGNFQVR